MPIRNIRSWKTVYLSLIHIFSGCLTIDVFVIARLCGWFALLQHAAGNTMVSETFFTAAGCICWRSMIKYEEMCIRDRVHSEDGWSLLCSLKSNGCWCGLWWKYAVYDRKRECPTERGKSSHRCQWNHGSRSFTGSKTITTVSYTHLPAFPTCFHSLFLAVC